MPAAKASETARFAREHPVSRRIAAMITGTVNASVGHSRAMRSVSAGVGRLSRRRPGVPSTFPLNADAISLITDLRDAMYLFRPASGVAHRPRFKARFDARPNVRLEDDGHAGGRLLCRTRAHAAGADPPPGTVQPFSFSQVVESTARASELSFLHPNEGGCSLTSALKTDRRISSKPVRGRIFRYINELPAIVLAIDRIHLRPVPHVHLLATCLGICATYTRVPFGGSDICGSTARQTQTREQHKTRLIHLCLLGSLLVRFKCPNRS
jgi:hypothetical protein